MLSVLVPVPVRACCGHDATVRVLWVPLVLTEVQSSLAVQPLLELQAVTVLWCLVVGLTRRLAHGVSSQGLAEVAQLLARTRLRTSRRLSGRQSRPL